MSKTYVPEDISPEQTELATELRIPFITNPHPRWRYVTAIVVNPVPELHSWGGLVPNEDEVRMVASFNDQYREYWYLETWSTRMREFAPYDIDGGAVGRYLIKHCSGGWGYRLHTWRSGPAFVPGRRDDPQPLAVVLDRYHTPWEGQPVGVRWLEWKSTRPEVFGAPGGAR